MSFDINNPAHLAELKAEVNTDPLAIGYNPANGDTNEILAFINAKNYTVAKPSIDVNAVKDATTYDAFDGLLTPEQGWLQWQTDRSGDIGVSAEIRQKLAGDPTTNNAIWAAADRNAMNAVMLALMDVPGGRAEVLWGYGTTISRDDWIAARDS